MFRLNSPLPLALFPADYHEACCNFAAAVDALALEKERRDFVVSGITPTGSALKTQTAWLGPRDAERVLVLISATHGVEGFAGSAIQCDLLGRLDDKTLEPGFALLFIHALTPWGFVWHRRCDQQGVDLNRNFIDFSRSYPDNPGYEKLKSWLYQADRQVRQAAFAEYIQTQGQTAFEIAISGGQYTDPCGPFYGGKEPSEARRIIETLIAEHHLSIRRLGVIDIHTGLGSYGYGEIICDHEPGTAGLETALRWYGDACAVPHLGTSSSVPKLGLLDYAWHAVMNEQSCYVTLEFGTYPTKQLFEVLLEDHIVWKRKAEGRANEQDISASYSAMRHHFCPDDPAWQELVLFRGRQVIQQAINGLLS